ncbi:AMP-binding protein [Brachybacterium rhamnosum]|uniref:AMP-binding protein n=1 Tax=Brachybacterium rhamnosum TaxID=173361 RepID=A0ABW4PWT1_9MICO
MPVRRSISRIIAERGARDPSEPVVLDARGVLTAGELAAGARSLARRLRRAGVRVDDHVEVSLGNDRDMVIACCAVWEAGATPLPLAPGLVHAERERIEDIARPTASIGALPARPDVVHLQVAGTADGADDTDRSPDLDPDLAASCWKAMTTSGSTGRPKIVRASAPALLDPERAVAPYLPRDQVQLVAGPLTHPAPFTYAFRGLLTGHRLVLLPRFTPEAWLDAVEEHRVTWAMVVPTMLHRLLRLPPSRRSPARLASLRTLLHIGAPCAVPLKREVIDWLGPERVLEVYAGSESNGIVMIDGADWLAHPGSVGRPLPGTSARIVDAEGRALPPGRTGLVQMRREGAPASHYLGAPSRRDAEGWDTLGDLGRLDAAGYLHLTDREDDMIDRGGELIAPAAIEAELEQHPEVRGALVLGLPDAEWGHRIAAVLDVPGVGPDGEDGEGGDAAEAVGRRILAGVRPRLGHRTPQEVLVVDRLLRDDAGKARRRAWVTAFEEGGLRSRRPPAPPPRPS